MATVESLITAVMAAIEADLPEVDYSDATSFEPQITTQSAALVAVPYGQTDEARDISLSAVEMLHRLRLMLYVRLVQGNQGTAFPLARNIGHRAMLALIAHDGEGYDLATPDVAQMTSAVSEVRQIDTVGREFVAVTLTVPVVQVEAI